MCAVRSFNSALADGQAAERAWVNDLRSLGRSVCHGKKLVMLGHNKNRDHCDSPDALGMVSIEIKQRNLTFTTPQDYPYDTVFVDDMHGLARERLQNFAYVYQSRHTGAWVWLTMLDRDERWVERKVFDRGRGHDVPTLVAPRSCLRASSTLIDLLYPHSLLEYVDGNTGSFLAGGGATEERGSYPAKAHPDFRARDWKTPWKVNNNVG